MAAAEKQWLDDKFIKKVVTALADEDTSVADVAKSEGVSKGTVMLARLRGDVPVKSRESLGDADDEVVGARVKKLRSENLSWGVISARIGVPESRVRSTFTEATGDSTKGLRLEGKGGRAVGESNGSTTKPRSSAGKKTAARNEPTKTSAADARIPLIDMDLAQLQTRLDGKTITRGRGAKQEKIDIKSVKSLKNGEVTFIDMKGGKTRVVKVTDIVRASR